MATNTDPFEDEEHDHDDTCTNCGGNGWVDDYYRGAGVDCLTCKGSGRAPGADDYDGPPDEREPSGAEMDDAADRYFSRAFHST